MSASYNLQSIRHRYGARTVLQLEQLEISAGSSLALIGPSGAGKSTLLRLLGLLESPSEGTVEIDGAAAGPDSPLALRRQITLMFQRPLLLRGSIEHNVGYGLKLRGQKDEAAITSAIASVGLTPLSEASVQTLSGGERQRVALARALVLEPRVLLLDEPTAHLDPTTVVIIEEVIKQLRDEQGTTIIFATHNLHQVARLAEDVLLLLDGEVIEYGPASKIMQTAHDPRTRAFIEGGIVY